MGIETGDIGGDHEGDDLGDRTGPIGDNDPRASGNQDKATGGSQSGGDANASDGSGHSGSFGDRAGNGPSSDSRRAGGERVSPSAPIDRGHAFVDSKGFQDVERATSEFQSAWHSTADVRTALGHQPITTSDARSMAIAAGVGAAIAVGIEFLPEVILADTIFGASIPELETVTNLLSAAYRGASAGLSVHEIVGLPQTVRAQIEASLRILGSVDGTRSPSPMTSPSAPPAAGRRFK